MLNEIPIPDDSQTSLDPAYDKISISGTALESILSCLRNQTMDEGDEESDTNLGTFLISFKSGHYKKITRAWKGDSVWGHFIKENGKMVHINKDEVEYMEEI